MELEIPGARVGTRQKREKSSPWKRRVDAGKSFIKSVRRISIVERHKRGMAIPLALGRPSLRSQSES